MYVLSVAAVEQVSIEVHIVRTVNVFVRIRIGPGRQCVPRYPGGPQHSSASAPRNRVLSLGSASQEL